MGGKHIKLLLICVGMVAGGLVHPATAQDGRVAELERQLREARAAFEKAAAEYQKTIDTLASEIASLKDTNVAVASPPAPASTPQNVGPDTVNSQSGSPWKPSDPLRVSSGKMYMDVGLVGTVAAGGSTAEDIWNLQPGGHDPNQRGFTLQGLEASFSGAVDPFFRGNANILFGIDAEGESLVELEEAWLETISLPGNLQLRGGQIYTEFGRQNPLHPHAWAFVDSPLVNALLLGPDGLRNPGVRASWLMPLPFFSELFLSVQDSHGETAAFFRQQGEGHGGDEDELPFAFREANNNRGVSRFTDLLFAPRYAASVDLTDSQTLLLGASAAFGPNASGDESGGDTDTQIYGADLTWKWQSPRASGGFPFVTWQTEAMLRKYEAGSFNWDEDRDGLLDEDELAFPGGGPAFLPRERLTDYGFYTQLLYGFRRGWVAGLRFDWLDGERGEYEKLGLTLDNEPLGRDKQRIGRWRLSPNLTWYPSEYSKIRLQYNYDDREWIGEDHSVWVQFEFILGAHAAHKF